jgi:hypothetical protein
MAQYNGISKRTKNALVTIVSDVKYDAGSGEEQAFQSVIGTTEGEFDAYPILRILPGELLTDKSSTAENERTLVFILRTVLPLEDTPEASAATYDKLYDLTDIMLDTLDEGDGRPGRQGILTETDATLPTYSLNATRGDWLVAPTAAGVMLVCDVNLEVRYLMEWL